MEATGHWKEIARDVGITEEVTGQELGRELPSTLLLSRFGSREHREAKHVVWSHTASY
jgi:hypothetical protein